MATASCRRPFAFAIAGLCAKDGRFWNHVADLVESFWDVLGSWDGPEHFLGDLGRPCGAFCAQMEAKVGNLVSFWGSLAAMWEPLASHFGQSGQLLDVFLVRLSWAAFSSNLETEKGGFGW